MLFFLREWRILCCFLFSSISNRKRKREYHVTILRRFIKWRFIFLTVIQYYKVQAQGVSVWSLVCCTFFVCQTGTTYIIKWLYIKIIDWKQMKIVNKHLHSFFLHRMNFFASQSLILYPKKLWHHDALFIYLIYSKWIHQYHYRNAFGF